jgi:hypothetical protein
MTIELIFENYPEPNIGMFGNKSDSIPFFLHLNKQYKICNIDHIYNSNNWVYPIAIKNPILEKDIYINSSASNKNFFINRIDQRVLEEIAKGRGWICIDVTEEPISNHSLAHLVNYIRNCVSYEFKRSNIKKLLERTFILTRQMKSSRRPYINSDFVFNLTSRREADVQFLNSTVMAGIVNNPSVESQVKVQGKKVYSFFNYDYTTEHIRFTSIALLQKLELLDYGHISLLDKGKYFSDYYHDFCGTYNKKKLNISFHQTDKVHELLDVVDTLDKSYINLVMEAYYDIADIDTLYITEKTFRNYYLKKPFIVIGQSETLSALKNIGYKSFHPYINEEYDETVSGSVRLQKIFKELKRLCSFTEEDWKEFYKNISPILEHNFKINTEVRPKTSYETFKEYING